jgi:transcriptional regulator with XRE-family HTH domain
MTTGDKIAALRKQNHFTQEQLAQLLGVSRQSISKYESDLAYPETEKLIRLSELFGCTVDELLRDRPMCEGKATGSEGCAAAQGAASGSETATGQAGYAAAGAAQPVLIPGIRLGGLPVFERSLLKI